jgi:hypothetical protein
MPALGSSSRCSRRWAPSFSSGCCAGPRSGSGSGRTPTGAGSSRRSSSNVRSTGSSERKRWSGCRPAAASVRPASRRHCMSSVSERLGGLGSSGATGMKRLVLLVLLPTAMTYINPGHVGIVIHRVGGGVDPTPGTSSRRISSRPRAIPSRPSAAPRRSWRRRKPRPRPTGC